MRISQKGFTLIELMVGLTVGLIVLLAAGNILVSSISAASSDMKEQRLDQTTQALVTNMQEEIRRAGYTISGVTLTKQENGLYYYPQTNCITFSRYSPDDTAEKFFGYLLNNYTVYYYESVDENASCSDLTNWVAVTDPSLIQVDTLTFTQRENSTALIDINMIAEAIGLTINGSTVKRDITVSTRIRNI